jgi:hypothetical protein
LAATIIQLGCPAVGVTGYPVRHFKIAAILEKIRDPGCPKRMVRVDSWDTGVLEAAFDHHPGGNPINGAVS